MYSGRPVLIARALMDLLGDIDCVARAAITTSQNGEHCTLVSIGDFERRRPDSLPIRLCIGGSDDSLDVWLEPLNSGEAAATITAIVTLLSKINELEHSRSEQERRTRLWPIEDVNLMNEHAVISGTIRDLMTDVRRVAPTKITVLLTGDSATGA